MVAREGERTVPVVAAPAPLRRYLNFARLPDPALEVARRVLDDDPEFRGRVASTAEEDSIGRAGWLFLHRPDGWSQELDALLQQAAAAEIAAKDERLDRGAQRRLAGAEAALAKAEGVARAATEDAALARSEVEAERSLVRAGAERIEQFEAEVAELRAERAEIIRKLKAVERTAAERNAELRSMRHELRMVQAELAQALPGGAGAGVEGGAGSSLGTPGAAAAPVDPGLDRVLLSHLVADAAAAASALQQAMAVLSVATGPPEPSALDDVDAAEPAARRPARPVRAPVALPPAVFDDAVEAAEFLVRVPGVLVLVDGYNVSNAQWHGMPPADQRARLLGACGELHARAGVEIEVVFDGTGEQTSASSLARSAVRFHFTPSGVEADDVLIERVGQEPVDRPVVVVSSDRRVREGARSRGANILGARQFLATLRR